MTQNFHDMRKNYHILITNKLKKSLKIYKENFIFFYTVDTFFLLTAVTFFYFFFLFIAKLHSKTVYRTN